MLFLLLPSIFLLYVGYLLMYILCPPTAPNFPPMFFLLFVKFFLTFIPISDLILSFECFHFSFVCQNVLLDSTFIFTVKDMTLLSYSVTH